MAFAESEIRLGKQQDDGATLRDHLTSLWRQTGVKPQALEDAPALSPLVAHLWAWFVDLNGEREQSEMSVNRITSGALRDWCWATGNRPELWERTALRMLDRLWLKEQRNGN